MDKTYLETEGDLLPGHPSDGHAMHEYWNMDIVILWKVPPTTFMKKKNIFMHLIG